MRVTAPPDRRYRRAHLKPGRKRRPWSAWRLRLLAVVLLVGVGGYATHHALTNLAGLRIFLVRQIVVHGNHRLSTGEVVGLLDGLRGQSIIGVDLGACRRSVMNSPWVAHAAIRRTLPSTIDVTVEERTPLGIARLNGALYLLDDRGTVIDEYGPNYADLDLPIIDGLSASPDDPDPDVLRALLVQRLLESLRGRNMGALVSQIDVSDPRNAVVLLEGDPTSIRLGDERFAQRLQSYFDLAPSLRERVPEIDYVDLRFDERVYVRPAERAPAPAAEAAPPPRRPKGKRSKGMQTG
jgi:cell division septal protein FtsQ